MRTATPPSFVLCKFLCQPRGPLVSQPSRRTLTRLMYFWLTVWMIATLIPTSTGQDTSLPTSHSPGGPMTSSFHVSSLLIRCKADISYQSPRPPLQILHLLVFPHRPSPLPSRHVSSTQRSSLPRSTQDTTLLAHAA